MLLVVKVLILIALVKLLVESENPLLCAFLYSGVSIFFGLLAGMSLVGGLFGAEDRPFDEIIGATGRLYLEADGRVHRKLAWAQFERGVPVALPDIDKFQFMFEDFDADSMRDEQREWQHMPLEP